MAESLTMEFMLEENVKTGPSFVDTALGRIIQGTKVVAEDDCEKIFFMNFWFYPDQKLRKWLVLLANSLPRLQTCIFAVHHLLVRNRCAPEPSKSSQNNVQAKVGVMLLVPSFRSHLSSTCWSSVICDKDPMPKSGPHSYAFFWRPPGYRTLIKDPIWSFWHAKYKQFHHGGRAAFHGSWNRRAVLVCHPYHNKLEYCI